VADTTAPVSPDVTTGTSPVTAPVSAPKVERITDPGQMSESQRADWKLTGNIPEKSSSLAASTPAKPAEQAASTDATNPGASETPKPPKNNAETRKQQLQESIRADAKRHADLRLAIAREEGRLEALRQGKNPDVPQASSPAPADEPRFEFPTFDQFVEQHAEASYEDYIDARTDARSKFHEQRSQDLETRTKAETELATHVETFRKQFVDDPTLATQIAPVVREIIPTSLLPRGTKANGRSELGEKFLKSPVGLPLMRHFSSHPEDLQRFDAMGPEEFYGELAILERELKTASTKAAAPAAPPTNTITNAPTPPTVLGTKPTESADPIKAALARGDFDAYRDLKNKAEIAARR
jgi:hypothetical protein